MTTGFSSKILWPVALGALIVFESSRALPHIPGSFPGFDKVAHFGVFGLLATLVIRLDWPKLGPVWWAVIAIGLVSLFGASDEWHQRFTPGRSVEFGDWLADTLGAVVAVALYRQWQFYQRILETPLGRRRRKATPAPSSRSSGKRSSAGLRGPEMLESQSPPG